MERLYVKEGKDGQTYRRIILLRKQRWLIWALLVFLTINSGIVNGALASCGGKIKADLHMMNLEFSTFLGFYAVGRMCGAFFLRAVIDVANRKYLLIFTAFLKSASIFLFTLTPSFPFCMISRLLTGVANALVGGMCGGWLGQYAIPEYKTFMTALLTFATPFGRAFGLQFEMYFGGPSSWKKLYFLNSGCLFFVGVMLMCYPSIYFSQKLVLGNKEEVLSPSECGKASVFNVRESLADERELGVCQKLKMLFTNPIYFCLLFTRLTIALINAGFVFGLYGYVGLNYPKAPKVPRTWVYSLTIITAGYVGSTIGGKLTKSVGGYENKKSFLVILVCDLLVGGFILPMALANNWILFSINFYGYMVFASAVLPNLNGLLLTSVPAPIKGKATTFAALMQTAFGGFLAPYAFGTISAYSADYDTRFVLKAFAAYAFLGSFFMLIGTIIRFTCNPLGPKEEKKEEKVPVATGKADALINAENPELLKDEPQKKSDEEKEFESKI
ncbi:MAG: MFS transporter [archaeon]|nr:MFS transporter [archaeon]